MNKKKETNLFNIFYVMSLIVVFLFLFNLKGFHKNLKVFWDNGYNAIVLISLAIVILLVVDYKYVRKKTFLAKNQKWIKWIFYIIFLPLAILPMFRCYFKVPYVFCKVCPKECPWGNLRNYFLPSFIVLNLDNKRWCSSLCPYGTIQNVLCTIPGKKVCVSKKIGQLKYFFLVVWIVLLVLSLKNHVVIKNYFYAGGYVFVTGILVTFVLMLVLSIFIPRIWCNIFCPIGSASDVINKIVKKKK